MDEKKKVIEDVDKDRRYAIDAAIVRTMKSRKVLQHQQVRLGDMHGGSGRIFSTIGADSPGLWLRSPLSSADGLLGQAINSFYSLED